MKSFIFPEADVLRVKSDWWWRLGIPKVIEFPCFFALFLFWDFLLYYFTCSFFNEFRILPYRISMSFSRQLELTLMLKFRNVSCRKGSVHFSGWQHLLRFIIFPIDMLICWECSVSMTHSLKSSIRHFFMMPYHLPVLHFPFSFIFVLHIPWLF